MDFVSLVLSGAQLVIKDEVTNLRTWAALSPISADITSPTETTDYPLAGTSMQVVSVSADSSVSNMQAAKVIMPTHMAISVIALDQSTVDAVLQGFANLEATYSITTRNIIGSGMSLVDVDLEQTSANLTGVGLILTFEQTSLSSQNNFNPRQASDQSSMGISVKDPQSLTSSISSIYNNIKSKIGL